MSSTIGLLSDQAAVRSLELDDVKLTYIVDGSMLVAPEEFFPTIPSDYWENHPETTDADGYVSMSAGGLLVERCGHRLLIDAGLGPVNAQAWGGPMRTGAFLDTLAALGHSPSDIDALAFTHIHVDHTGWALSDGPNGGRTAIFPNAAYLISEAECKPLANGDHPPGDT